MIQYKCKKCGGDMESPGSLIGKMETCPHCRRRQIVPDPDALSVRQIHTKAVGVTYANDDGTSRQQLLRQIAKNPQNVNVSLKREPRNRFDSNAVAIQANGHVIGHLSRELAADIAPIIDAGGDAFATAIALTGGETLGMNISIQVEQKSQAQRM